MSKVGLSTDLLTLLKTSDITGNKVKIHYEHYKIQSNDSCCLQKSIVQLRKLMLGSPAL